MPDPVSRTRLPDLTFHLTVEDVFDFERYSFAHVPVVMQRTRMLRLRMGVTAAICLLLTISFYNSQLVWPWWIATLWIGLFAIFFGLSTSPARLRSTVEWRVRRGIYREALAHQVISIDAAGYDVTINGTTTRRAWSEVQRLAADDRHMYWFLADTVAQIIPRRSVDSTEQWQTFTEQIACYHRSAQTREHQLDLL